MSSLLIRFGSRRDRELSATVPYATTAHVRQPNAAVAATARAVFQRIGDAVAGGRASPDRVRG
jgi:hypothetical protein